MYQYALINLNKINAWITNDFLQSFCTSMSGRGSTHYRNMILGIRGVQRRAKDDRMTLYVGLNRMKVTLDEARMF